MTGILPQISMSDLQRHTKRVLADVKDYAVVQSHSRDVAFVLHPALGKVLVDSGMLDQLKQWAAKSEKLTEPTAVELQRLIGNVLRELSKR
ncbi:MAG: hypothetical protein RIQ56_626 [Candidatus Parcubacteria bacterium]|jgi:hypothetical protein